eukprot:SAG22_NODE_697_length_7825_cov_8.757831_9_plen_69_part_00
MDLLKGIVISCLLAGFLLAGLYKDRILSFAMGWQWFDNDQRIKLDGQLPGYPHGTVIPPGCHARAASG